ncbi:MAG: hypothetical protein PUP92_28250 [Rhizonema sp. PD38]|nr:hypothetical protein [Rhizonema sp. PD38]
METAGSVFSVLPTIDPKLVKHRDASHKHEKSILSHQLQLMAQRCSAIAY